MSMDWPFSPWRTLAGGMLIGLSAALTAVLLGRIAGISGIVGNLLQPATWRRSGEWHWRLAFVLGLLAAPLVWQIFGPLPAMALPSDPLVIISAGLLVGYGTRLGSGCTSGHGVCGLARLSPRSLVAVLTFMATGMLTVSVMRHVPGWLE